MKALIISNNGGLQKEIAALSAAVPSSLTIVSIHGGLSEASNHMATETPHIVILDASSANGSEMSLLEGLNAQHPQTTFMLLTPDQSPEMLLRAMRAGVREVLALPLEHKAFNDALSRIVQKVASSIRNGKIISFISCKGGSGTTFIATNLGYALAAQAKKKVLLIDLNQQFGDAALYVSDKKPTMTLSDVCAQINRIDAAFLESSLVSVFSNFGILPASDDPTHAVDINPGHIETILRLARNYYDFIVLDLGRQIDPITLCALDHSDLIYPVLQLTMPYIRDASRLLEIFRSLGYRRDKTRLIVNRYEKSGELRLSDLESAVGGGEVHTLPNNYKAVTDSINQGVPVLQLARSSPVAKSLAGFVDQLAGARTTTDSGLISRFFTSRLQANA